MTRSVWGKLLNALIVVWVVVTLVFIITRVIGDPASVQLPPTSTAEQRYAYNEALGYNEPLLLQYVDYVSGVLHGDIGESTLRGENAFTVVFDYLPNTLKLIGMGMLIALIFGTLFGMLCAMWPRAWWSHVLAGIGLLGLSAPSFWVGLMLVILFGVQLGLLPVAGTGGFEYLILPAVTFALPIMGRIMMMVRASMIEELSKPYVMTAKAKGLPLRKIMSVHAMRNALLPLVSLVGWETATGLAGYATSIEVVFNWTGVGFLALHSIENLDFAVVQAVVFVVAILIVLIGIAVDACYRLVDPKQRLQGVGSE
jgi:peptide/nickel transport system permease protein